MSNSKIEERLFKVEKVATFDPNEGKKTFLYETEKTAGALWCSIIRIQLQMIFGFAFKEQELFFRDLVKKS